MPVGLKIVRSIPRSEMELHFLRAEWGFIRPAYDGARAAMVERLLERPDLGDVRENRLRHEALMTKRDGVLAEVPGDLEWFIAGITATAFRRLRVFRYRDWNVFAPAKTVSAVAARLPVLALRDRFDQAWLERKRRKIVRIRASGGNTRDLLIALTPEIGAPLTLLEGNHRAVAALIRYPIPAVIPRRIVIGVAPSVSGCPWYRG